MKQKFEQVKDVTKAFEELQGSRTKLRLFGGKGGVGKTTTAAATGLYLSEHGQRVLVVSSDPAPSLSDIFEQRIGGEIVEIKENLYAIEIDATKAIEHLKDKYGVVALNTISTIVPIEEEALDDIPNEVVPGLDELFAMEKVLDFVKESEYDYIIWDTAPTGHTLRLLALPGNLSTYASGTIKLYSRFSGVLNTVKGWFGGDRSKDDIMDSLNEIKHVSENIRGVLSDAGRTEFTPVVIPEALALYQTESLRRQLVEYGINIKRIIINSVLPENENCQFCQKRRKMQQRYIAELRERYRDSMEILEMPLFPEEIKGLEPIKEYSKILYGGEDAKVQESKEEYLASRKACLAS